MVVRYLSDDELSHHGIKGQKWGVRRYQNSDGSLTNAGRKRYSEDSNSKAQKTVYVNRLKYTTGKSKGVKRRANSGAINGEHTWSGAKDINSLGKRLVYKPSQKSNTFSLSEGTAASGRPYANIILKDKESAKVLLAFYDSLYKYDENGNAINADKIDAAISSLIAKYGEIEIDPKLIHPDTGFFAIKNISDEDKIAPMMAKMTAKKANVAVEDRGKNGMPSVVEELARLTDKREGRVNTKNKKKEKFNSAYVSNGAPSSVKPTINGNAIYGYKTAKRHPAYSSNGQNGMPSSVPSISPRKKKK